MIDVRTRILLVTKSTGGVAEYIRWLVKGINKHQFHITVACLSEYGREFAEELRLHNDVETIYFAMNRYKISPISDAHVCFQLMKLLRSGKFDLVHGHASKPGFLIRIAALGTGIPVLYSPHCFSFHAGASWFTSLTTSFLEKIAAYFTTRIVAIADGERELARSYKVGSDKQFIVIHTGIDPAPYRQPVNTETIKTSLGIPSSSPVIGSVGRLNMQKSPLDFVRMAEVVHRSKPDAHFVWVGDGPLEKDARYLSESLHIDHVMHWLGYRKDAPQLIRAMECLVLTSLWEGLPLVLLEAMAAGTAVVATDILGTRELILHEKNGFVAPVGDSSSLARFVLELLADSSKRNRFIAASHERIESEFTRTRMVLRLQDLYLETILKRSVQNG